MTFATEPRRFLTVTELAEYLRVSKTKAYQLVSAGEVPAVRVGGQLRIPRDVLDQQLIDSIRKSAA